MCPSNEDIIYVGFKGVLVLGMGLHFACVCVRILPVYFRSFSIGQGNCIMLKFNGDSYRFYFFGLQKGGGTIDLEPCLTHTSTVEPTLAPVAIERTITTRAAASVCPISLTENQQTFSY